MRLTSGALTDQVRADMTTLTCTIDGCDKKTYARSWCSAHYARWRKHGDVHAVVQARIPTAGKCAVDGCDRMDKRISGYCVAHYSRLLRHGDFHTNLAPKRDEKGLCSANGCAKADNGPHGLCANHYKRQQSGVRVVKTCLSCGVLITKKYSGWDQHCSLECRPRCAVDECNEPCGITELCRLHRRQMTRRGTTDFKFRRMDHEACAVCGELTTEETRRRKHCSPRCQMLDCLHKGKRPKTKECVQCGCSIDLLALTKGGQFKKSDTKLCDSCKRKGRKFGITISDLAKINGTDCKICGEEVDLEAKFPDPFRASRDHILPRSKGGSNAPENLQITHLWCNQVKSDREGFTI